MESEVMHYVLQWICDELIVYLRSSIESLLLLLFFNY